MERVKRFIKGITVEPVMFMYLFCYLPQEGMHQDLTYFKICRSIYNDTICNNLKDYKEIEDEIQEKSSHWNMASNVCFQIPSFIFTMYIGSWSDSFSRKFPLFLSPIGGALSIAILIFVSAYEESPIWLLVVSKFVLGIFGGVVTSITSCISYITSVTKEKNWTVRIARTEACDFLGCMTGLFLTGYLVSVIGITSTFVFLVVIHGVNLLYIAFMIRDIKPVPKEDEEEAKPSEDKSKNCCFRYFSLKHIKEFIMTGFRKRDGPNRKFILLVVGAMVFVHIVWLGHETIQYLYMVSTPLNWNYTKFSYFVGVREAVGSSSLLFMVPLIKRFVKSDWILLIVSVFGRMAHLMFIGLAFDKSFMIYLAPVVGCFSNFAGPSSRTILASLVDESEKGKIIAFVTNIESKSNIIATLIYNSAYPPSRKVFNGLLFIVSAGVLVIPLGIFSWLYLKRNTVYPTTPEKDETDEKKIEVKAIEGETNKEEMEMENVCITR